MSRGSPSAGSASLARAASALLIACGALALAPHAHASARDDSLAAARSTLAAGDPIGRYAHTAILDTLRHRMLMFGGFTFDTSDELWELPLDNGGTWHRILPNVTPTPFRGAHVAILDPVRDRMVVFGGADASGARRNDVWVWPLSGTGEWAPLTTAGVTPAPRTLHSAIYDPVRDRLIVFGGYIDNNYMNDVWALSLSGTPTWTRLLPSGGGPSPRREASAVYDPVRDRMIIFGGTNGGYLGDMWALSLGASPAWTQLFPSGAGPTARSGHSMVYDRSRDAMWMFAGRDGNILNDLWRLDLSAATPAWQSVTSAGGPPLSRVYHSAILDPTTARMVVFSGYNGGLPNDTWFLTLNGTPAWYQLGTTPPPPPHPQPVFVSAVSPTPTIIELGQSFTLSLAVRNSGPNSDDGRIVVSFPSFTAPGDDQRVSSASSGDAPGYVELPAGSPLQSATCQTVVASYLTVQYRDNDWTGNDLETDQLVLDVRPPTVGTFYIYVRATMHDPAQVCGWFNGVPNEGDAGYTDQEGWSVRRFAVSVVDAPEPVFLAPVSVNAGTIEIGQSFTITTTARNSGAGSDDGRIVVSFPGFTDPADVNRVDGTGEDDAPGYREVAPGGALTDASCQPITAPYVVAEFADAAWVNGESNLGVLTVTPRAGGAFTFDVRCTMHKTGAGCEYRNAVPGGGLAFTDPQGWAVRRFTVTVLDTPDPAFTSAVTVSASTLVLGQSFTIGTTARNNSATSDDGRIVVSFPGFTDPADVDRVSGSGVDDPPGYREIAAGGALSDATCQPVTAPYLVTEFADAAWTMGETNSGLLTVTPRAGGTFSFDVRCTMHKAGAGCEYRNAVPTQGQSFTDPQGWPVRRFTVTVLDTPDPFVSVIVSTTTLELGQSFTISTTASNNGATSDDGRIVVSFPGFTDPADVDRVSGSGLDDVPGYREIGPGGPLADAACQPVTAPCVVTEFADAAWTLNEAHTRVLTVTPRAGGTFAFDVRCTMHRTGAACDYRNAVPSQGQAGFTDPQGWAVHRFTVTVQDRPIPHINIASIPATIALGQTFTIVLNVWNDGASSDDGRISIGLRDLINPDDGDRVSGTSTGGDAPGYVEHLPGSTVDNAACGTATTGYLIAEYVDADWGGLGNEANDLTLTVRPRVQGWYSIDIRASMRRKGVACAWETAIPDGGDSPQVDPQGWPVKRFLIYVSGTPLPAPVFTSLSGIPAALVLGQSFTVQATVLDHAGASADGRIAFAFPALDQAGDADLVSSSSTGDTPGYLETTAGGTVSGTSCQPIVAGYLVAEYVDNDWVGQDAEANTFAVTVQPRTLGDFYVYVRSTMRAADNPCLYVNAVPQDGITAVTDQQGWLVKRYTVKVTTPTPAPVFEAVTFPPAGIALGESFTITATVGNGPGGGASADGRIVIGFPQLTNPLDHQSVSGSGGDTPGYAEHPAGSSILKSTCQPTTATYLSVEAADDDWLAGESNTLTVTVTPQVAGTFIFETRATLGWTALGPCQPINAVPSAATTTTDPQGFQVARFAITVDSRPPVPQFTASVLGIPASVVLGESFTLIASARDDGAISDDGRIVVSLPALTGAGDGQWVSSTSTGDTPGYLEHPAGSVVLRSDCTSMTATCLVAEYADDRWQGPGNEINTLSLTVQPRAIGRFYIDVRASMHVSGGAGCAWVTALPGGGTGTVVDAEGWSATRFAVDVVADGPPVPPIIAWSRIATTGGPSPRFSSNMVYHPNRDALVLYGGSDGHYRTDSWVFPLAPGGAWTQLAPGGPIPRQRINTSMIWNPVEDHLVIFAGMYDFPINDLTALALSPVVWWFPATPNGPQPGVRFGQGAIYDPLRRRMVVFGGYGEQLLNDVWEYPLPGDGRWNQLNPSGPPPPPRTQHTAVYDPVRDRVIVFGGDGGVFLGDVWELRLGTLEWNQLFPLGAPPSPRREHTMVYDPGRDQMILFGGFGGTRQNDVWSLSLGNPPVWTRLGSSTAVPGARMEHTAVFDPARDRMLMFGGDLGGLGNYSNELWSMTFNIPTPVAVALASAEVTPDAVRLVWTIPDGGALAADVRRSTERSGVWQDVGTVSAAGGRLVFEDRDVAAGTRYGYRLIARAPDPGTVLDEEWVTVPPRSVLALTGASPNPSSTPALWVAFSLPDGHAATLELYDLHGRRLERQDVGSLGAGDHRVPLSTSRLAAGVYLVRLTRGDRVLTAKACVVR